MKVIRGEDIKLKRATFRRNLTPWQHPGRRVGGPRKQWAPVALEDAWRMIREKVEGWGGSEWNQENEEMRNIIEEWATREEWIEELWR